MNFPLPLWRAHTLRRIGKIFGFDYVLGVLVDTEKSITQAIVQQKNTLGQTVTGSEGNHVVILQSLLQNRTTVSGEKLSRIETKHKTVGSNALRAPAPGAMASEMAQKTITVTPVATPLRGRLSGHRRLPHPH